jgi:GntR family transcriptional repressor for pyruvate dehydrogenase complex
VSQNLVFEHLPREQTRHSQVVQRLRDALAQGQIVVGEQLPSERELCEQLGVSRTIVREAIRVLASEGILAVSQGRRAVVAADLRTARMRPMRQLIEATARETFGDVLDTRLILEVASAERAAQRATNEDIADLGEALKALKGTNASSPAGKQLHSNFHRSIARASHNMFLFHMIDSLLDAHAQAEPTHWGDHGVPDLALLPLGHEAHAKIFRPIRDRSTAAAGRAMRQHLSSTIQHHPDLRQ